MAATMTITVSHGRNYFENGQKYHDGVNASLSNDPGKDRFSYTYYANLGWVRSELDWTGFVRQVRLVYGAWKRHTGMLCVDVQINGKDEIWWVKGSCAVSIKDKERHKKMTEEAQRCGLKSKAAVMLAEYLDTGAEAHLSVLHDYLQEVGLLPADTPHADAPPAPEVKIKVTRRRVQWVGDMYEAVVVREYKHWVYEEVLFSTGRREREAQAREQAEAWLAVNLLIAG